MRDVQRPEEPRLKGIDYLTQSWRRTARVASAEAAQASADRWCVEVADARVRRIDGAVSTVAQAEQREPLLGLPTVAFPAELNIERIAAANALVSVRGNRYSVPPEVAGAAVEVSHRCGTDSIEIHIALRGWPGASFRSQRRSIERAASPSHQTRPEGYW